MGIKKKIKKELIGTSDYPSNKIFTISNFITFTRLILTLVFLYLFVTDNNRVVAIVIYAIAASTDWMDGQIARMTKTVSWLGKVMDPICDRALLFTGVLGLVVRGELPIWVCVLIIGRDIYLGIGTLIVRHYHRRPIDVVFPRQDCHGAAHDRLLAHAVGLSHRGRLASAARHVHGLPGPQRQSGTAWHLLRVWRRHLLHAHRCHLFH